MSHQGRNYFHTDDPTDLDFLIGVLTLARDNRQSVRIYTLQGGLQIKRGQSVWSPTFESTPDPYRDEPAMMEKP